MKKLLAVLVLMSFTLSATPKVYNWVYINKIKNLNINENAESVSLTFNAEAGLPDGNKENIPLQASLTKKQLSINTNDVVQVKTIRFRRETLEMVINLVWDILEENE